MSAVNHRSALLTGCALLLIAVQAPAAHAAEHHTATPTTSAVTGPPRARPVAQASAAAAVNGRPVEIVSARTDSTQTFAEPGGGFQTVESLVPNRVQRHDGSWVPIDTTLSRRSDGSIAPVAITTGVTLSGGGAGPMYTLSQNGTSMSTYWPGRALPNPTLSGATATYADVLPGVDLLLSATASGISELLEVTNAAAARNPALDRLTYPMTLSGLTLTRDATGNLTATDRSGHAQFSAPPPQMWDSSAPPATTGTGTSTAARSTSADAASPGAAALPAAAAALQAGGPTPGDRTAAMTASTGTGSLSLVPDRKLLTSPTTRYPVFIDPEWDGQESTQATWLDVWKTGAGGVGGDWKPENSTYGGIQSGVSCDNSDSDTGGCIPSVPDATWQTVRSYLNFPIYKANGLGDADFVDAQLSIRETWSWQCATKTTIDIYQTDKADQGITWKNQPNQHGLTDSASIAYGDTCPAHGVTFNAKPALSAVQGGSNLTLELRATEADESNWNQYSWKRWSASSVDLIVYWRHAPKKPTDVLTDSVFDPTTGTTINDCAGSAANPDFANMVNPTWQASIDDADGTSGGNIDGEFGWSNLTAGNSGSIAAAGNPSAPGDTPFKGARKGGDGDEYKWWAYGIAPAIPEDADFNSVPALQGPNSADCYFQIDNDAPTVAPTITSIPDASGRTYASGVAANPVGAPAVLRLSDPGNRDPVDGSNDIVGYRYGVNSPNPNRYVPAGATDGSATITVTPFNPAALSLYVDAVDRAGNVSPVATPFQIETVSPPENIATLAWWPLNAGSGNTAADTTGNGSDVTLWSSGADLGCAASAGPSGYRCTLNLDGSSGRAFTAEPVLGNNGSFSVSAWVKPSDCSGTCVLMSQGGTTVSGFTLGYQSSCTQGTTIGPCWIMSMPTSDSATAKVNSVRTAPDTAATGQWTQVTGVYDATQQQLLVYINGGDGMTAGDGLPAASTAPLTVLPWSAPASSLLRLGSGWTQSTGTQNFWHGSISAACAFYGPLAGSTIQTLYDGGAGDGCATLLAQLP
jgi:hypothetical protein